MLFVTCSTGGILYDKTGANSIDHIVSIVGWGVSTGQPGDGVPAGTKYWIGECGSGCCASALSSAPSCTVWTPGRGPCGCLLFLPCPLVLREAVRNSWGTGWGDKGFAYAADSYAQPAFTEAFGVTL